MSSNELIGIIGGTGLYQMEAFHLKRKVSLTTPYGRPSDAFLTGELAGKDVVFLPRHGVGHRYNPSEVNYRANIWGMKKLGVSSILSISAVGSLKEEIHPGHMVVVDQFIDRTKGVRPGTFFEKGIVAHVSFADPLCSNVRLLLIKSVREAGGVVHEKGTYVCMEGPLFSTRAESRWYQSMGAHVIGMTNLTEAKLAREAEICYATLALSTDYDCWHQSLEPVTTDQIIAVLNQNVDLAKKIIFQAVSCYQPKPDCSCRRGLEHAIMTDRKKIPASVKKRLKVIAGKYL